MQTSIEFLQVLFQKAVEAAHPEHRLQQHLPRDRQGRAIVIGAGKASASMAAAFEAAWEGPVSGLVVTPYGHGVPCEHIEVVEASHPIPDAASQQSASRILDMVTRLTEDDTVIFLLSGGGSSLLALPAPGVTLEQKQQISAALLKSGATIHEINCVRKHLSAIKGGRLALACQPAKLLTFAISDVAGDDPTVIASGPSVADPTTRDQALGILRRHQIDMPTEVEAWLNSPESETPKAVDLPPSTTPYTVIATPHDALDAAAAYAQSRGVMPLVLGDTMEGESREVAKVHAAIAQSITKTGEPIKPSCIILSGGETTVTVTGNGRGGRNTEFLMSLARSLKGQAGIYALAADTDGIDGSEDNAGAILAPEDFQRAIALGLDLDAMLANNDGYAYFQALDRLLITGPTRTNVNDLRAVLVL